MSHCYVYYFESWENPLTADLFCVVTGPHSHRGDFFDGCNEQLSDFAKPLVKLGVFDKNVLSEVRWEWDGLQVISRYSKFGFYTCVGYDITEEPSDSMKLASTAVSSHQALLEYGLELSKIPIVITIPLKKLS